MHAYVAGLCIKIHFLSKFLKLIQKAKWKPGVKPQTVEIPDMTSYSGCLKATTQLFFTVCTAVLRVLLTQTAGLVENKIPSPFIQGSFAMEIRGYRQLGRSVPTYNLDIDLLPSGSWELQMPPF